MTEFEWIVRREQLAEQLKEKQKNGENLKWAYQLKNDSKFVYDCRNAFGNYTGVFKRAEIDYSEIRQRIIKTPEDNLEEIIELIKSGKPLDRGSCAENKEGARLAARINHWFGGWYKGLEKAREELIKRGDANYAEYVNADHWKGIGKAKMRQKLTKFHPEKLNEIPVIVGDRMYTPGNCPVEITKEMTGDEIVSQLYGTREYLLKGGLVKRLGLATITDNLKLNFSDRVLKFKGNRTYWLYHSSIADDYKKRHQGFGITNLTALARELEIPVHKVNQIIKMLDLNVVNDKHVKKELTKESEKVIREVIKRENEIIKKVMENINPSEYYAFGALEALGVSTDCIKRKVWKGELPSKTDETGHKKLIQGKYILERFAEKDNFYLSEGLNLINYFQPSLFLVSDLSREAQLSRCCIKARLEQLLNDYPEACFKLRKVKNYSRLIATKSIIPCLNDWKNRQAIRLSQAIKLNISEADIPEVKESFEASKKMVNLRGFLTTKNEDALQAYIILKKFLDGSLDISDIDIRREDLHLLYRNMVRRNYPFLEIGRRQISQKELEDIIEDRSFIDLIEKEKERLEGALYKTNEKLMWGAINSMSIDYDYLKKRGIYPEDVMDEATTAFLNCIRAFDFSHKCQLSTFVYNAVQNQISSKIFQMARRKKRNGAQIAMSTPLYEDEDSAIENILEDKKSKERINENISLSLLNENIMVLLDKLPKIQEDILVMKYGLNGNNPKSLREIGQIHNLTRERVRQIQNEALERLRRMPSIRKLLIFK